MVEIDSSWRGRPASVWTLVVLDLIGGALCAVGAIAPATPDSPATLDAIAAAVAVALAVALWTVGQGSRHVLVHLNLVLYLVATTGIVVAAASGEGAVSAASSYLLVSMYVAVFCPRRVMRLYVTAVLCLLAVALAMSAHVDVPVIIWLPPALACVGAAEVLSWLTMHLREVGVTDPLTGLPNRTGMVNAARRAAAGARGGAPLAVAVVDLDGFKAVNDRYGHAAGDRFLVELAEEWTQGLRPRDVVCRTGGDEFVFLLPDTDERGARQILDRLRANSAGSWSYGVSCLEPGKAFEECLARADDGMYAAKLRPADTNTPNAGPVAGAAAG